MKKKIKVKSFINVDENINDFTCKIIKKMKDKWFEEFEPKVGMLEVTFVPKSKDWVIFEHPDSTYLSFFIKTFKNKLVKPKLKEIK